MSSVNYCSVIEHSKIDACCLYKCVYPVEIILLESKLNV